VQMKQMNFCTLFDSNYIDMGLMLYNSLQEHADCFKLFVIAMDKQTYNYLQEENLDNMIVVDEQDMLDESLVAIKASRTRAEYCWTCSSIGIKYCIDRYNLDNCTYVDSDVFFFDNPRELIEEMLNNDCSVQIVPHRFNNSLENYLIRKTYGKYCVEFNTFLNDEEGTKVLEWWIEKNKEVCSISGKNHTYGDQKYLDKFIHISKRVNELENPFAGVAPWNFGQYKFENEENNKIIVTYKDGRKSSLIFYHFQNLKINDNGSYYCDVHSWNGDKCDEMLIQVIYSEYVKRLIDIRRSLLEARFYEKKDINTAIYSAKFSGKEKTRLWMMINATIIYALSIRRKKANRDKDYITI